MGRVFWNKPEIPIPPEAYLHKSDGSVRIIVIGPDGKRHEKTIGYFTSETHMHPNEFFGMKYQDQWNSFYGDDDCCELHSEMYMGMYVLALAIGYTTTMYPMVQTVYGPEWGNAFMDYIMYSILYKTDVTQTFQEFMNDRVLFSRKMYSDSDYSQLFKEATKDQHHKFRGLWLQRCAAIGLTKVWICIDGSNIDNEVQDSEYTEYGCPKSNNNKTIIGFMYAVSAKNGMPITYLVYEGGSNDCAKLQEMIDLLKGYGMGIEGVILDKGFCTDNVITALRRDAIDYVIMMPSSYHGCKTMKEKYSSTIKDKSFYAVDDDGVFGIAEETKLFTGHETKAIVNLYYDRVRGSIQSTKIHKKLRIEKKRLERLIDNRKKATISQGMEKYFAIVVDDEGNQELIIDHEAWDAELTAKGFFAIVSSKDFGAEKTLQIYGLRELSEVQYSILKSQEGYETTRVHQTPGIRSKMACAFMASIIRCEIELACKDLDYDTNVMIHREDTRVRLLLSSPYTYTLSRAFRKEELLLLAKFGIVRRHLEELAADYTKRLGEAANSQVRRIPSISDEDIQKKRGPGRPPGSKNKKTLQRESEELRRNAYKHEDVHPPKSKGGRPKGSKDKVPRKRRTKKELQALTTT